VFVSEPLYGYRLHAANTITESAQRARDEMGRVTQDYLALAMRSDVVPPNPFAPALATWGATFLNTLLSAGIAGLVDPAFLRSVALTKLDRGRRHAAQGPSAPSSA
jgi:hypothetical protein